MRRLVVSSVIVAAVLVVVGLVVATRAVLSSPGGPLVVRGRVLSAGGQPVSGIKVWLNAWPRSTVELGEGAVDVVGSAVTSATGSYLLQVPSLSVIARDAMDGVIHFDLMTGDRRGWDLARFSRGLPGGSATAVLRLRYPPI